MNNENLIVGLNTGVSVFGLFIAILYFLDSKSRKGNKKKIWRGMFRHQVLL